MQLPADIPPGEHQVVMIIDEKPLVELPISKEIRFSIKKWFCT
ncbi:hypothetical protein OGM63_27440 [Plectonema radiosum NIES-515]|uniref:Uncharacterized protein n=1 Tax=Plectonema radiosum NIES-515 TaxID=2986073 RepID=A0ABT3B728_9CYAN|nr:hypothetical protein [Plectonema radiosum]MCV3217199.1 hypothetical protein [Plectonema radiosum NIES-515]